MSRIMQWLPSRRWLFLPPVLIGVSVLVWLARSKQPLDRVPESEFATPVKVMKVTRRAISPMVVGYGTAEPIRRWTAVAEVGGRVTNTRENLRSGNAVRAGEVLFEIDPQDYQLRIQQREADLSQAESQLAELKLNQTADEKSLVIQRDLLGVRQAEVERVEELAKRSAASVSEVDNVKAASLQQQQTVQTLINSLSLYESKFSSAQAAVATARAKVAEAQRDLERTEVRAPFDGLLFQVDLQPGQSVSPNQSLFEVIDVSSVEIAAQFSMDQLKTIGGASTLRPRSTDSANPPVTASRKSVTPSASPSNTATDSLTSEIVSQQDSQTNRSSIIPGLIARVGTLNGDEQQTYRGQPVRLTSVVDERTRTLGVVVRVDHLHRDDVAPPQSDSSVKPSLGNGRSITVADRLRPIDFDTASIGRSRWATFSNTPVINRPFLRAGMYCRVSLETAKTESLIPLPRTAVEENRVLVLDDQDRIRRREVTVAFINPGLVAVSAGLLPGDRVLIQPQETLLEGQLAQGIEVPVEEISINELRVGGIDR
ncbi:MAG: HlyD family efflux transporter periplasmic adaptor subunit [Planctomycetota bacterium]